MTLQSQGCRDNTFVGQSPVWIRLGATLYNAM